MWERIILHHVVFLNAGRNALVIVNTVAMIVIVTAERYRVIRGERNDFQVKDSGETERLI